MDEISKITAASLSSERPASILGFLSTSLSQFSARLKLVKTELSNVDQSLSDTSSSIDDQEKATEKANKKTREWITNLSSLGNALNSLGKSGSAYFTGLAGSYAASATTIVAYNNLAGDSAAALISGIQTASNGTISSVEMMTAANNALALGLKAETIPELARVATALGTITGTDAGDMFTTLSSGVSESTAQLLAQQGIILDTTAAYAQYAAGIGSTASALTGQQQQAALLNALMEQGQTLIDSAGNSQYALGTSMEQAEASVASMNFAMAEATSGPMQLHGMPGLSVCC